VVELAAPADIQELCSVHSNFGGLAVDLGADGVYTKARGGSGSAPIGTIGFLEGGLAVSGVCPGTRSRSIRRA
jgi:hypothetical protein